MEEGVALMHGTLLGFFVIGVSYMKLFFRRRGDSRKNETSLFNSDERLVAWSCPRCKGTFLEQPPWLPGTRGA